MSDKLIMVLMFFGFGAGVQDIVTKLQTGFDPSLLNIVFGPLATLGCLIVGLHYFWRITK